MSIVSENVTPVVVRKEFLSKNQRYGITSVSILLALWNHTGRNMICQGDGQASYL